MNTEPQIKSITYISLPKYTITVWRYEDIDYIHDSLSNFDLHKIADEMQDLSINTIARILFTQPRVTAVEVKTWDKSGLIIHG